MSDRLDVEIQDMVTAWAGSKASLKSLEACIRVIVDAQVAELEALRADNATLQAYTRTLESIEAVVGAMPGDGIVEQVTRLADDNARLREALAEIVKNEPPFKIDPLDHAHSSIEHITGIAAAALAATETKDGA